MVTLAIAMLVGGGQGSVVESLVALGGLALILMATHAATAQSDGQPPSPSFWLVPAALLALPVLQLIPLPYAVWSHLPGRPTLAAALSSAGIDPAVGAWSVSPVETEGVLWSLLVPAGVFMAALLMSTVQRRVMIAVALAFAAVNAFVGLWQLLDGPQSPLYLYRITNLGEAVGLFANRNHLASLLAVCLPVAAGVLADRFRARQEGARDLQVWLLTALLVLLSVAVTATKSRAGFALFMISVVASAVVLFARRRSRAVAGLRPWLRAGAVLVVVMIVQLTLYGMLSRLEQDPLEEHRWSLTSNTILAARPTRGLGYGFGTFVPAYDEIGDASADIPPYVNHAHDDYAELWLEGGIPAVALALVALVVLVAQSVRLWRGRGEEASGPIEDRGLRAGAAFGLLLLALHSFVDYPLRTLTMASIAGLLAAVVLAPVHKSASRQWQNGAEPNTVRTVFNR